MEFHGVERDVNSCNRRIGEKEQKGNFIVFESK